jgi:hypothetical protein
MKHKKQKEQDRLRSEKHDTIKEATIVTEVETTKSMAQHFIAAWKNREQNEWLRMIHR